MAGDHEKNGNPSEHKCIACIYSYSSVTARTTAVLLAVHGLLGGWVGYSWLGVSVLAISALGMFFGPLVCMVPSRGGRSREA